VKGLFEFFSIEGKTIKSDGLTFFRHDQRFGIPIFDGVKEISSLAVQPLNDKIKTLLAERGKVFKEVGLGHHFMQFEGFGMFQRKYGTAMWKSDGRVMIDIKTFQRMNPEYPHFLNNAKNSKCDTI